MRVMLIVAVVLGLASSASAYEGDYTRAQIESCRFRGPDGVWSKREARDAIRCVARLFSKVSTRRMLRVAKCESRYDAYAVSSSGTYRGLFQHHRGYWLSRVRDAQRAARLKLGSRLSTTVFSARSNAFVTAWLVQRGGWGPWSCA
jgi:hypothetical protein